MEILKPRFSSTKSIVDNKGSLSILEFSKDIPFLVKRLFYMYDLNPNIVRGNHANKNSQFLFIVLSGSCKIKYYFEKRFIVRSLEKPNQTLFLPRMIWKEMYDFKKDTILLVLSDLNYDSKEYIFDFNEYKKLNERNSNESKF
jgi:dTDP-4-dehydrorhamnose 3,5-epimerase-like enzyme